MDWKVLILNQKEFDSFKDVDEVINRYKVKIDYIRNWFKMCKTFEGKKINSYLDEGKLFD